MNKNLKYVVKIFHHDRLLAQEMLEVNDDVLSLKLNRDFHISSQIEKIAGKAIKQALKTHDLEPPYAGNETTEVA